MSRSIEDVQAEKRAAAQASRITPSVTLATSGNGLKIQLNHSMDSGMDGPPTR